MVSTLLMLVRKRPGYYCNSGSLYEEDTLKSAVLVHSRLLISLPPQIPVKA